MPMSIPARLTYISGFFYYAYTALVTFFGPVIPIVMLAFLPGHVRLRNFVVLLPAMFTGFVLYPLWHRSRFGPWDLATGRRPRLGARVRHLGRRLGQVDELAPDPDTRELAAPVPGRDHLVERQHGRALVGPGGLADGDAGVPAIRGPAVLRLAQPGRRRPRDLPRRQGSMKSRVPLIVAVLLAMFALGFAGSRLVSSVPHPPPPAHASLPPALASYLGTFEPGAPPDYGAVASFARTAGRQPNLVGYYSGWTQPFDMAFARMLQAHGAVPFVQIDPTAASINGIATAPTMTTCAPTPTACATSVTPWSSASGTR